MVRTAVAVVLGYVLYRFFNFILIFLVRERIGRGQAKLVHKLPFLGPLP